MSIPGLERWLDSPQGRHVLGWESARIDGIVADIFGYNALQLGLPERDLLRENRIPFRQKAGSPAPAAAVDVNCDLRQLPFAANSIDLVVMPHVLEFYDDPHQILREVERILIPEGQIVLTGFNPYSLWGLRRRLPGTGSGFPWQGQYLSATRTKDWLQLLGFEVDRGRLGCYLPPIEKLEWLQGWCGTEGSQHRWWNFSGGIYILRAIKRTHGMRLITPNWRKKPVRAKALRPVVQKEGHGH